MIDTMQSADVTNAERFERVGVTADAQAASHTRDEFAAWLRECFDLDAIRSSDVVLAINEALANCAEFAYREQSDTGTMDIVAWHDAVASSITVLISDQGSWRTPAVPSARTRGRGIPLIEALSDRASIEASDHGTRVTMEWTNVAPATLP
ncbi:ATP-binding protein [Mycolicibacterium sp. P9-64]|uniref:ATP-binding protein n=1 Tax=Mycolicibacterium sp. P9-64 TaxID=2024612 RepID=UPI0011EEDEBC|nr:ATP-binding protein [Mycolicibacterium sp. P9-64]KAA0081938.1 ATP-binding protein [Mycolicibacterium sp. P9-64]